MGQITGKTYGFGRVSPITRPSQFAVAREPGANDEGLLGNRASASLRHGSRRSPRALRIVALAAILLVTIGFGILAVVNLTL